MKSRNLVRGVLFALCIIIALVSFQNCSSNKLSSPATTAADPAVNPVADQTTNDPRVKKIDFNDILGSTEFGNEHYYAYDSRRSLTTTVS